VGRSVLLSTALVKQEETQPKATWMASTRMDGYLCTPASKPAGDPFREARAVAERQGRNPVGLASNALKRVANRSMK
jgi:hypothetical protein